MTQRWANQLEKKDPKNYPGFLFTRRTNTAGKSYHQSSMGKREREKEGKRERGSKRRPSASGVDDVPLPGH